MRPLKQISRQPALSWLIKTDSSVTRGPDKQHAITSCPHARPHAAKHPPTSYPSPHTTTPPPPQHGGHLSRHTCSGRCSRYLAWLFLTSSVLRQISTKGFV
ncbi:hypothetical protein E2C01_066939 [Portunus trituberculatus]|uniref:Uncharacterized protein n=1 Tax=Portunus trituberculatus TaxID=210409 RepID=A0A5B7HTQ8_PORTR|nr:hypothetical protein [Portunus trituberculatus]